MVGPELCRDDERLQLALSYTDVTIKAIKGVRTPYPPSLRFLAKYLDRSTRSVLRLRRPRRKFLSADQLAQDEFILNVASISSSSAAAPSMIYDLIDHPDVPEDTREEISKVSKEHNVRFPPAHWTFVSFASQQLNLDNDVYADARSFQARRFLRKREEIDPNKFHFASVSDDYIIFGPGFHACPGRFLAHDVLKPMFIQLLTRYDIKLVGETQNRPPDIPYNFSIMPNLATQLMLKEKVV
ncbi:cytochrome P450 [Biscogniauxia marginata]|nr:cytochrome P450 [Biscogniauxia marginata]